MKKLILDLKINNKISLINSLVLIFIILVTIFLMFLLVNSTQQKTTSELSDTFGETKNELTTKNNISEVVKGSMTNLFIKLLILLLSGMILFILSNYFLVKLILKPLSAINEKLNNCIKTGDINISFDYMSKDELGGISGNINKLMLDFVNILAKLRVIVENTKSNHIDGSHLSQHESHLSIDEIRDNVSTIEKKVESIDKEIVLSSDSIKKLKEFYLNIMNLIRFQASTIRGSSKSIEQMGHSVTKVAEMLDEKIIVAKSIENMAIEGEEEMRQTIKTIKKVSESTGSITKIIELIDDVADQTNILAMNASIQSAQAGEFGKTFHVVANEIRTLANTTASHSIQISEKLKDILTFIKFSKESSEEAGGFFTSMVFGIGELSMSMNEVKMQMNKLLEESKSVTNSLYSLVEITQEVKNSSGEIGNRVDSITNLVNELNKMSAGTKSDIEDIISNTNEIYNTLEKFFRAKSIETKSILALEEYISKYKLDDTKILT